MDKLSFWQRFLADTNGDLIKEMIYGIKAAEAQQLYEEGAALRYILEQAGPLDVLGYLEKDADHAVLYRNGQPCLEGDLIEIALFLEELDDLSGYVVTAAPLPKTA
jgi:hypothetical protein